MKWEVLYHDWSVYSSDTYTWESIPRNGLIRLTLIFNNKTKTQFSGWDVYSLQLEGLGFRVTTWKDEEISDPFFMKGTSSVWYPDGSNNRKGNIIYTPASDYYNIPLELRKRGKWVVGELAVKMGLV